MECVLASITQQSPQIGGWFRIVSLGSLTGKVYSMRGMSRPWFQV